jgi:prevent-host-death family protein
MHTAVVTASQARSNIYQLIDQTAMSHEPITITGKRNSAVLMSAADWSAIQETLYLLSVPGLRETVRADMASPSSEFSSTLVW